MKNTISYEACLTLSITDNLKNGFWYTFNSDSFYFVYDENPKKITDFYKISLGILPPKVGNVLYNDVSLWNLSDFKRSKFISENISTFSIEEFQLIKKQTVYKIIYDEIFIFSKNLIKSKKLTIEYLKSYNLLKYAKKRFHELNALTQNKILCFKLTYKKPKYLFLNLLNIDLTSFDWKNFILKLKKMVINKNICCLIFTDIFFKLSNFAKIDLSDNQYYVSLNSTYTIPESTNNKDFKNWYFFKTFIIGFFTFFLKNFFWLSCYSLALFFSFFLTNIFCVINFKELFNLDFNISWVIKFLLLILFIVTNVIILYLIKKNYIKSFNTINFLITKGYSKFFGINWYIVFDVSIFLLITALNVIINYLLSIYAKWEIYFSNMIWPIIIYFFIHAVACSFHYVYSYKYYAILDFKH
ncbi:hypothetical protein [Mycoplasmoides alvi]|uniref:hypothetical protein n=1 Tax=Mycoplasmoides alvi TaxID=78580 RepID=UPI00051B8831|nr:hypothetical protein [Mycoplasmoides alvi]